MHTPPPLPPVRLHRPQPVEPPAVRRTLGGREQNSICDRCMHNTQPHVYRGTMMTPPCGRWAMLLAIGAECRAPRLCWQLLRGRSALFSSACRAKLCGRPHTRRQPNKGAIRGTVATAPPTRTVPSRQTLRRWSMKTRCSEQRCQGQRPTLLQGGVAAHAANTTGQWPIACQVQPPRQQHTAT